MQSPLVKTIILLTLLAGTLACTRRGYDDNEKTVFLYNEPSNITSLDPAYAKDQANIWACNQLFNGLIRLDTNLKPVPCIAKQWEISRDGREYSFLLRNDVYFHQTDKFTSRKVVAEDFVYSFSRILDPEVASPGSWIFSKVEMTGDMPGFIVLNDSVLIIRLNEPFPPFLSILGMQYCSVVPIEAVENTEARFSRYPVGTGPFRLSTWKEGVKMVLVKNDRYFEYDGIIRLPYLDAVSITFLSDQQSAFLEFMKGNLDFLSGIDPSFKDELLTRTGKLNPKYSSTVRLMKGPYLNTEYLGIMMGTEEHGQSNPLLLKKVRRAVNMGFDREKMIRYLRNGIGIPGNYGFVPAGMPAFDPSRRYYSYDPDSARKLLNSQGLNKKTPVKTINLHTTADYLDICKYIQSQLSLIGMEIEIEVHPAATLKELKAQGKLSFFRASWIADYPDEENYLSLFYSGNFTPDGPNYTHFSNPHYDSLYLLSQKTVSYDDRVSLYRSMNELIMEECPVVVLYYDEVTRFVSTKIEGMENNPMNLLDLRKVRKRPGNDKNIP